MSQASVNSESVSKPRPASATVSRSPRFQGDRIVDRRGSLRCERKPRISLIPMGSTEMLVCRTDNIGEGGLCLTAPIGYGLAVGQRHEVLLGEECGQHEASDPTTGDGHYATVVWTKMLVGRQGGSSPSGKDRLTVGLKFDQPVVL